MKILLGALILIINLYACSQGISNVYIAGILCIVFIIYYVISRKTGNSIAIVFIELMCYTWSSSWLNIFGGKFADIPIPWFYIMGIIVALYILFKSKLKFNRNEIAILYIYIYMIIFGFVPIIIAQNFGEALSDYITYLFFFIMTFVLNFTNYKFIKAEYYNVLKAFVNASFLASIGIIIQSIIQIIYEIDIVNNTSTVIMGGNRIGSALIFADTSSAMICLGVAIIIIITNSKLVKFKNFYILSIIAGMGLSSTRTGLIALLITFIVYASFQKSIINKIKLMTILSLVGATGIVALSFVRNVGSLSDLFNPSGRIEGYTTALRIWLNNPVLGIGFGDTHLVELMNNMAIPHFTFLNLLVQAGVLYLIPFVGIIYYYFRVAQKNKMITEIYAIFLSVLGSCFIPTLFSARFFTIVIIMVCIRKKVVGSSLRSKEYLTTSVKSIRA